ncbi:MAG: acyl-CoA dehydrogenase [Acidobacteria bacterium]|nr:acyl-CoA dehydrogenase [Acidobacteriota bacterium]
MFSPNQILAAIFPDEVSLLLARGVREFGERELTAQLRGLGEEEFAGSLLPLVAQRSYLGASVPSSYGGAGGTLENYLPVIEGIAAIDGSLALTVTAHESLAGTQILLGGSEEQKSTYLPKLISGEMIAAWCLTEPNAGSNILNDLRTTLLRTAEGWVLNGEKTFITNGCHADLYVVIARALNPDGHEAGPTACLIERKNCGGNVIATPLHGKMGMRRSDTASVTFDQVPVAPGNVLGPVGEAGKVVRSVLLRARVGVAALTLGIARDSLDRAVRYTKERNIGSDPLFNKPLTRVRLVNMLMSWWVAWQGVHCAADFVDQGKAAKIPAFMAKVFATEMALQVCDEAIQLLGGYGYMTDYKVEQNYRDARLLTVGEGTSEILRLAITDSLEKANFAVDEFVARLETSPDGASHPDDSSSPAILSLSQNSILLAIERIKQHESNGGPPFHDQFTAVEVARMAMKLWIAMQAVYGAAAKEAEGPFTRAGMVLASAFAKDAAIEISHSAMNLLRAYGQWDERLAVIQRQIYGSVVRDGPSEVLFTDLAERILG